MLKSKKLNRSFFAATALAACSLTISAPAALAEESALITLNSLDGTVTLTGEFQKFDNGYYFLVVPRMGLISIAMESVECQSTQLVCADLTSTS